MEYAIGGSRKLPEEVEQKKAHMLERLQKREDNRIADSQQRKEDQSDKTLHSESSDFFLSKFSRAESQLNDDLSKSDLIVRSKLGEHFDGLIIDLQKMQKFLTDSTFFLPSFELQKAQETINSFQSRIQNKRDELIPKKKFAFKIKKKTSEKTQKVAEATQKRKLSVEITECSFRDARDQVLVKTADEINETDVALSRLINCTVKLHGTPSAIHINNLTDCTVLCGPVSGSIFIDNCTNSTLVLPCQQLRIHNTTNTVFYIHVTSRAIIEDSNGLQFAPYNWDYEGLEEHYALSGLDKFRNSWDDVDDFNWLARDEHSPNWRVMDEADRVSLWKL